MKPWHLIQSYKVLGVTGYLEIRYGAGMHKVPLWTSLLFFFLIFFRMEERDTQEYITEAFKTGQGIF